MQSHPLSSSGITQMLTAILPNFFIRPADGEGDTTESEQAKFYGFLGELRRHYDVRREIAAGWDESPFNDGDMRMAYLATGDSWEYMFVFCYRKLDDVWQKLTNPVQEYIYMRHLCSGLCLSLSAC
jgi:hypothetical protein